MRQQTYLVRKGARYHFRRRLPTSANDNAALTLPLHTADPIAARRLARRLAVRWDEIAVLEGEEFERGNLTIAEQRAIFRAGLEEELAIAVRDLAAPRGDRLGEPGFQKIFAGAYTAILHVRADADHVPDGIIEEITADGWSDEERQLLKDLLSAFVAPGDIDKARSEKALKKVGAPVSETTMHEARASLLRGMIEAQQRAALFHHPLVQATGDPVTSLLDDGLVLEARRVELARKGSVDANHVAGSSASSTPSDGNIFFARTTEVRFSHQLQDLLAEMFENNNWQPDNNKTRHMLEAFAWLTGDKKMSDYEPSDVAKYVRGMARIPKGFEWGRLHKSGGMAVPFELAAFPQPKAAARRSDRTINSHLSKLAAAATILKKTYWLPKQGYGQVMDFEDARKRIARDDSDPQRMPLTEPNLVALYGLPLWQGGGGSGARLKPSTRPMIYQDAAYWVPLLGTYAGLSREEACGLELVDVEIQAETPYFLVQANMTKSKDGETKAGIKRASRRRALPLHPQLLRLGFAKYVAVIAAEGWEMLFPELYGQIDDHGDYVRWKKPGGPKFYGTAWRYMIDAAHAVVPLPRTSAGKYADFHSQRTFHYSAMAGENVSEALLARHVGHSPRTTGGKNYNRRALAMGEEVELAERLTVLVREVPNVTGHVPTPERVNLLHLNKRSRVGSAPGRNPAARFLA